MPFDLLQLLLLKFVAWQVVGRLGGRLGVGSSLWLNDRVLLGHTFRWRSLDDDFVRLVKFIIDDQAAYVALIFATQRVYVVLLEHAWIALLQLEQKLFCRLADLIGRVP